jgi:UDPglucose 6-dehydrogenase
MNAPIIVDGRNVFDPATMAKLGFTYFSMGRNHVPPVRKSAEPTLKIVA